VKNEAESHGDPRICSSGFFRLTLLPRVANLAICGLRNTLPHTAIDGPAGRSAPPNAKIRRSMMKRANVLACAMSLCCVAFLGLLAGKATAVDFGKAIPDASRVNGFAIGCQAYSFNRYSVMEAIDKCRQTGGKVIEFYPGQTLSAEDKAVKFDHNAPDDVIEKVKAKLKETGIQPVAYGVVGLGADEAENRKVFDFCKKMGILVVTSEPPEDTLPLVAKMAKEYDIPVGLHNHPQPSRYWDPKHVLEVTKDLNEYVGSCADTGHWMRSNIKPMEALQMLKGRIINMHIKDLNEFGKAAHDVPFGTGQADMPAILSYLREIGFKGPMDIEYEYNWTTSVPEITQCIDFVRNFKPQK
jgi:sugar phosphate isomerase/epimerase